MSGLNLCWPQTQEEKDESTNRLVGRFIAKINRLEAEKMIEVKRRIIAERRFEDLSTELKNLRDTLNAR